MDRVTADTYLVLRPDIRTYGSTTYVYGIKVDRARASKPALKSGEILIRVKLNFDKQQLIDSVPVVEINVTDFHVERTPEIVLEAV